MKATERIYVTADRSRAVPEGDPEAAILAYAPGDDIPDGEAKRLGIGKQRAEKPAEAPAEAKATAPADAGVEDKAVEGPRAGKGK